MKRTSTAVWRGSGKGGTGSITSQSQFLNEAPYKYNSRFGDETGTNPEELIAAAHAACFTMKLAFLLSEAGFEPELLETVAEVSLLKTTLSHSHLNVKGVVQNLDEQKFWEFANNAKDNCPVSKALNMAITLDVHLEEMAEVGL